MRRTILRLNHVIGRVGLTRSTIYLKITKGEFPVPISLGARAVGWLENDIEEWIESRIAASRTRDGAQ